LSIRNTRVAVLVDLSFFLERYKLLRSDRDKPLDASEVAEEIQATVRAHLDPAHDLLHRIFIYDCKPLEKKAHNPVTKRAIDFSKTHTFRFRSELLSLLTRARKVVLRLGELADRKRWRIDPETTRLLLSRSITMEQLTESAVVYDVEQKGVDVRIALDIASLAYKKLADRVVLITGDSDFVPAAKLARREGLDVILDPLWAPIVPALIEHVDGLRTHWPRERATATSSSA
jgi:uncharacterized LabA/DUF88 family protein